MTPLAMKMLFRRGGTAGSALSVALIVAILTSMNAGVNYINLQAQELGTLVNIGETYIIISQNSTSVSDSRIDVSLANQLTRSIDRYVEYSLPQKILSATIITKSGNRTLYVRGVEDPENFFKLGRAYVNGSIAKGEAEANVGEIVARILAIDLGDEVRLTVNNNAVKFKVVGIFKTLTQLDGEIIVSMKATMQLTKDNNKLSLIEFAIKDKVDGEEAINIITELLPRDLKVVKAQQLRDFIQNMNQQTLTFMSLWSVTIYAVAAVASYIIATRLIAESRDEMTMIRALGAKKRMLFTLVLIYTTATALLGSILGIALGTVGTQTASTILRWIWPSVNITPFLEAEQALQTILLTLASSTLGCLYPALRSARTRYMEQPL